MTLRRHRWLAACGLAAAASITAAGCSSNSSGSAATGGTTGSSGGIYALTAGVLHAFTGQNAFFGLNAQNSCKAAAAEINKAGGIMGHPLSCSDYDTKGDPADAVPVTNRMLVSACPNMPTSWCLARILVAVATWVRSSVIAGAMAVQISFPQ